MNRSTIYCQFLLSLIAFLFLPLALCFGQDKAQLKEVKIAGNIRVEEDGIRLHIKAKPGSPYDPAVVEQDVKSIYRMGFFDDVQAELSPDGVLTYTVKERPYIREVKIQGNSQVSREKIETALGVAPRTILDRDKVSEGVEKVRKLYTDQGYMNAQVESGISLAENNQAVVQLEIDEGSRLLIQKISFEGNKAFSDSELKGLMATKEKDLLSYFTSRGVLDQDMLTNDLAILASNYYDHGYVDHRISEPVIVKRRDGIEIVIRVEEGAQYRVGKVELGGDLIDDPDKMLKKLQLTTGQIFSGSRLRSDITNLTDQYSNKGYAFVQVDPQTKVNPAQKDVDVSLLITEGPPVYVNRVTIAGNTKTRDKVIRREMTAVEQEPFAGDKIKESRNALQRTGYFEDVQLTTKKTDQPDAVDLLVDVKEGASGAFSVGGGYSAADKFLFTSTLSDKNLFGRGLNAAANITVGGTAQDYVVNFTEPYFMDTFLTTGLDLYDTLQDYTTFTSRQIGFGLRTSYPLKYLNIPFFGLGRSSEVSTYGGPELANDQPTSFLDYMRGGMVYGLTKARISGINSSAPPDIQNQAGITMTSALTPGLTYDSRDNFFNATQGTISALAMKFAGLGGDTRFLKTDATARWYYPLLKDPNWGGTYVFSLAGTLGYGISSTAASDGTKDLPLFERYFPGGMNSVRGFKDRTLGPQQDGQPIGGDKQAVLNVELIFPILEQYGLKGVVFFDVGQAFLQSQSLNLSDFRRSVGFGGRWLSPFGPLRVELGFPLNKKPGDQVSVLGFAAGSQ